MAAQYPLDLDLDGDPREMPQTRGCACIPDSDSIPIVQTQEPHLSHGELLWQIDNEIRPISPAIANVLRELLSRNIGQAAIIEGQRVEIKGLEEKVAADEKAIRNLNRTTGGPLVFGSTRRPKIPSHPDTSPK